MAPLRPRPSKEERSRRAVIAVCVLSSIVFWFSIKLSRSYTAREEIALDYRLPQGLAFANEPPTSLEATVEASGWDLLRQVFRRHERLIVIDSLDLADNPDGVVNIRQEVAQAFRDEGLRVDAMTNERLILRTEQVATKRVPVVLVGELDYARGFLSAYPPVLRPDSVTLSGPGSVLATLSAWPTDSLVVAGIRDTFSTTVAMRDPAVSNLSVSPRMVDVVVLSEQFTEKSLYLPVHPRGLMRGDSVTFFPREVLVTFAVGMESYSAITASDFEAVADLSAFNAGATTQVAVTLARRPTTIRRTTVRPRVIEVYLREDPR